MDSYSLIKYIHIGAVMVTVPLFIYRGYLILIQGETPGKLLKILPHSNDTILLSCAILLIYIGNWPFWATPWLIAKVALLFLYIIFGILAFRQIFSQRMSLLFFFMSLSCVLSIIIIAITKKLPLL